MSIIKERPPIKILEPLDSLGDEYYICVNAFTISADGNIIVSVNLHVFNPSMNVFVKKIFVTVWENMRKSRSYNFQENSPTPFTNSAMLEPKLSADGAIYIGGYRNREPTEDEDGYIINVYETKNGTRLHRLCGRYSTDKFRSWDGINLAVSCDGNTIIFGCGTNFEVWQNGHVLYTINESDSNIKTIVLSADGNVFLIGSILGEQQYSSSYHSNNYTIKLRETRSGEEILTICETNRDIIPPVFIGSSNKIIYGHNGIMKIRHRENNDDIDILREHSNPMRSVLSSTDGNVILVGNGGLMTVWKKGEKYCNLIGNCYFVDTIVMSENGIVVSKSGNSLKVWDVSTKMVLTLLAQKVVYKIPGLMDDICEKIIKMCWHIVV